MMIGSRTSGGVLRYLNELRMREVAPRCLTGLA